MNKRLMAFLLSLLFVAMLSMAVASGLIRREVPPSVSAEEQGVPIQLSYVPGLSTWGPTNVYGSARLWPSEQLATISVHLLPHLLNGQQFAWWVMNSQTNKVSRLSMFNTNYAGDLSQDVYLLHELPVGANEVMVTVWHPGDSTTTPGGDRSLVGQFPVPPKPAATSTPSAGALPTMIPGIDVKPGHHPTYIGHLHVASTPIHTLPSTGGGPLVDASNRAAGTH